MNHDITTAACATAAANQGRPIAIFVHVHFRDVWDEIASWIAQTIRRPFHLILTTSHTDGGLRMPEGPLLVSQTVIVTANRGRDVRPFLEALRTPIDYEIGLKLHTKRSTHRLEGGDWGRTLVQALLPGPEDVDRLVERMSEDRRLAMVAPDGMLVSLDRWMGSNRGMMRKAMARLSVGALESAPHPLVFCAGSMFWFRREALAPFRDNDLDDLFAAEAGQVDGTMAHALERLFAPVAELATDGVITTMKGASDLSSELSLETLRTRSRRMADQPTPYLRRPPRWVRWALLAPGARAGYAALPTGWRQWVRSRLRR
jgi:lipopolysaccharide biosynthesis protein